MLYVSDLNIQQAKQLADIPLPAIVTSVIVFGIVALIFVSFSRGWLGLVASYLFIGLALGVLVYSYFAFKSFADASAVDERNVAGVQQWASEKYGITLGAAEARSLVGTASEGVLDSDESLQYGSTLVTPVPAEGQEKETVEATLINDEGTWKLGDVKDDRTWVELRKPE